MLPSPSGPPSQRQVEPNGDGGKHDGVDRSDAMKTVVRRAEEAHPPLHGRGEEVKPQDPHRKHLDAALHRKRVPRDLQPLRLPALRAGLDEAQAHRTLEILDALGGSRDTAKSWFTAPNAALRRRSPTECLQGSWVPEGPVAVKVLRAARVAPEASARTI